MRDATRLGMILNLAHASEATWKVEQSTDPMISSHKGLFAFNPNVAYNATDEMIKRLAARRGVVGVHFSPTTWTPRFQHY